MTLRTGKVSVALALLLTSIFVPLASCNSKNAYWDEGASRFCMPAEGLCVNMPQDSNWIVADPASLPPNVLFCAVMPVNEIGLYLCADDACKDAGDISDIPQAEIERFISAIMSQSPENRDVEYSPIRTQPCEFLSKKALRFDSHISIGGMGVNFEGYVFCNRGKLLAYAATQPYPCSEERQAIASAMLAGIASL